MNPLKVQATAEKHKLIMAPFFHPSQLISNSLIAGQDINFSFIIPGLFLRINSCPFDTQDGHGKPDRRHRHGMSPSRRR